MGTRANVLIKSTGLDYVEPCVLLYHHFDGYPENMLHLMLKYEEIFEKEVREKLQVDPTQERWLLGRVGHLSSFIISTDILGFEISNVFQKEEDVVLHSDIDFYYVITADNREIENAPKIYIEVYTSLELEEHLANQFWETGNPKFLKKLLQAPFTKETVDRFLKEHKFVNF